MTRACFVNAAKRNPVASRAGLGKREANLELVVLAVIKQHSKNKWRHTRVGMKEMQPAQSRQLKNQQEKNDCN